MPIKYYYTTNHILYYTNATTLRRKCKWDKWKYFYKKHRHLIVKVEIRDINKKQNYWCANIPPSVEFWDSEEFRGYDFSRHK